MSNFDYAAWILSKGEPEDFQRPGKLQDELKKQITFQIVCQSEGYVTDKDLETFVRIYTEKAKERLEQEEAQRKLEQAQEAATQLEKDGVPTFYIATDGSVCTHRMNATDIPVWCRNGEDGSSAMTSITQMSNRLNQLDENELGMTVAISTLQEEQEKLITEHAQLAAHNARLRESGSNLQSIIAMFVVWANGNQCQRKLKAIQNDARPIRRAAGEVLRETPNASLLAHDIALLKRMAEECKGKHNHWGLTNIFLNEKAAEIHQRAQEVKS